MRPTLSVKALVLSTTRSVLDKCWRVSLHLPRTLCDVDNARGLSESTRGVDPRTTNFESIGWLNYLFVAAQLHVWRRNAYGRFVLNDLSSWSSYNHLDMCYTSVDRGSYIYIHSAINSCIRVCCLEPPVVQIRFPHTEKTRRHPSVVVCTKEQIRSRFTSVSCYTYNYLTCVAQDMLNKYMFWCGICFDTNYVYKIAYSRSNTSKTNVI